MACIFNTVVLDISAGITDSFEGRGLIRGGLIGGSTVLHSYLSLFARIEFRCADGLREGHALPARAAEGGAAVRAGAHALDQSLARGAGHGLGADQGPLPALGRLPRTRRELVLRPPSSARFVCVM